MFIKIRGNSVGLKLPLFGTGLNVATIGFISIRPGENGPIQIFRIQDTMNLKSGSASAVFSMLSTDWTFVDSKEHPWVCRAEQLIGKTIQIEITGAMFGAGKADVQLSLIADNNSVQSLWLRFDIQSKGLQLSDVKVRGVLEHHNGARTLECKVQ